MVDIFVLFFTLLWIFLEFYHEASVKCMFMCLYIHEFMKIRRVGYSRKRNRNQKDSSVCSAKGILRRLVRQEKTKEGSGRN